MPFGYGGGITSIEQVRRLFSIGVEKVILNSAAATDPSLVAGAVELAGSSSVVVSIDAGKSWRGSYDVFIGGGKKNIHRNPAAYAAQMEQLGAGEILLNAIHRDGTMDGYDLELIRRVSSAVTIPVVAVGGAGQLIDFREAVDNGASAVGAGSLFVFHGKHRAVLITYPPYAELERLLETRGDERRS
jgi:cyclase